MELNISTHPGIGDISWVYSKLVNCGRKLDLTIAADQKTKRAIPYVSILPEVEDAKYGTMLDYIVLKETWNGTWEEIQEAEKSGKKLYISANNWLERGNRLEDFIPDLPTTFHYELQTSDEDKATAEYYLPRGTYVGIYTASLGGAKAWKTWEPEEWLVFMKHIGEKFPHVTFVLIGAGWDLDFSDALTNYMTGIDYVNLVGKTANMGVAVEVLKRLSYFIGYASGMGIMSNVIKKPVTMLYPTHLSKLMYAWPSFETIGAESYVGLLWERPLTIFQKLHSIMERHLN